jgi:hypothetical protein
MKREERREKKQMKSEHALLVLFHFDTHDNKLQHFQGQTLLLFWSCMLLLRSGISTGDMRMGMFESL